MITKFNTCQFDWTHEYGRWYGVADASDLGLAPGEWPTAFVVEGYTEDRVYHDATLPHPDAARQADEVGHRYDAHCHNSIIHILND